MFKIFNLVVMTRRERTNEILKNMDETIKRDWDILRLATENTELRLRLEQAEKNNSEIKFGGF